MPSYPDSVRTFTTKLDGAGNPINAAFVNDLQDEVNAIEAGLLNGTARLNSSGSTVNTLSVSSNSTFAIRPTMPPPQEAALVFLQSTYAAGSSGASTLSWLSQAFVVNSSVHSTTTNPTRLTPQSTGVFLFTAQVSIAGVTAPAMAQRTFEIQDSSLLPIASWQDKSTTTQRIQVSGYKRFDVGGGYAICAFGTDQASTHSLSSGVSLSWFAMTKL